jgi:hypothetical protein
MAGLDHVQPGDLITSALLNTIIDALVKLDEKITKCCEAIDSLPKKPGETKPVEDETRRMVIDRIVLSDASPGDTVTISGRFVPDLIRNRVSIGGKEAKVATVTETEIDVVVPTFGFRKRTPVDVVVGDPAGVHATSRMTVGSPEKALKTGVALVNVTPAGALTPGTKYTLGFIVASTGKDNLTVAVLSIDPRTGKRRGELTGKEFSFASKTTQKFEVPFQMPKQGAVLEVTLTKGDTVITSESYPFVVAQEPPVSGSEDVFDTVVPDGR